MKNTPRHPRVASIDEQFDLDGATAFGGSNLAIDYAAKIGLLSRLQGALGLWEKRCNAKYPLWQIAAILVLGRMLGLERIAAFDALEQDPLLQAKLGLKRLPDTTLLYKDLSRLGSQHTLAALAAVTMDIAERVLTEHVILDLDSTVETVYGTQEGTAVGYNPTKRGRASYHPQLAFDGRSRAALHAQLRPGNAVAATDAISFVQKTIASLPKGSTVSGFRADKGYQSDELFSFLEEQSILYAVKMKVSRPMVNWADQHLVFRPIGEVDGDILEVAHGRYRCQSWSCERRVVIIRQRREEGLFAAIYEHQAIATNTDWDPEDVFHFYNHRCTMETMIREAKEGFGIDAITSQDLLANKADLQLKLLAYNLSLSMQFDLGPLGDGVPG